MMQILSTQLTFGRLQQGSVQVHESRPDIPPYKISGISLKGDADKLSSKTVHGEFINGPQFAKEKTPDNFMAIFTMPAISQMLAINIRKSPQNSDLLLFNCNSPPTQNSPSTYYFNKKDELMSDESVPKEEISPLAEKIRSDYRWEDRQIQENYLEEIRDAFTLRAELIKARKGFSATV